MVTRGILFLLMSRCEMRVLKEQGGGQASAEINNKIIDYFGPSSVHGVFFVLNRGITFFNKLR